MVTVAQANIPDFGLTVLLNIFLVLFGAYLLIRVVTFAVSKLSERTVEHRITVKMVLPVFKAVVYAAVVYYIFKDQLSLSESQLLALSGLFGAAIGFGVKDLFSSLVGGLIIIVERPYKIGDKIEFGHTAEFGNHYGEVTDIGIRSTTLQTPNDTAIIVPNDAVFKSSVANANAGQPEMLVAVEFFIDSDADIDEAKRIVAEALATSRYVFISEERPILVLEEDSPYYRSVRGKAYINDTRNEFVFKSDVSKRVRREFERIGIEKPEPVVGLDETRR